MAEPFERINLQRVIAVINGKGGVGKTTLTANIGGLLAASGWRTLVVDLDHQGNLGLDLGYSGTAIDDDGQALSKALTYPDDLAIENAAATLVSQSTRGGDSLQQARLSLARVLDRIAGEYDVILLDCPPGNDIIQSAAVAAARYILIPAKTEDASRKGLKLTAERLDQVIDLNPDLDLLGVVLFASGASASRVRADFAAKVVADLGGEAARGVVFENYVRHAEATAASARDKGLLVHELDDKVRNSPKWYERLKKGEAIESPGPQSAQSVADSLQAVTSEMIERLMAKEAEAATEEAHV
jgi:chromosome partitioning protein